MIRMLAALAIAVSPFTAAAQERIETLDLGGDRFRVGGEVVLAESGARDVFLGGESVALEAAVEGSAHLAGRRVESAGEVGGDLYGAGVEVRVTGPVAGDATVAGYDVAIENSVGGNLRAGATNLALRGPVTGAALLSGDGVEIAGPISGDAVVTAETLTFGPEARIDGSLVLYAEEDAAIEVPASVIPPERVERRAIEGRAHMMSPMEGPGWGALAMGFLLGVLILTALATLVATLAPRGVARLGEIIGAGPLRTLGAGFVTQAALIGSTVLLAATIVGVLLVPVALIAAVVLGFLGYIVGVYRLGVWGIARTGALEPDTFPEYALAALVGALLASLAALVPLLGWLFVMALTLVGVGAIAISMIRPRIRP
jgi:cytoskeletal protein CcmA (bactofilin family)